MVQEIYKITQSYGGVEGSRVLAINLGKLLKGSNEKKRVKKALADCTFDSRDNFNTCEGFSVEPGIKVRKNSCRKRRVVGYVKRR